MGAAAFIDVQIAEPDCHVIDELRELEALSGCGIRCALE